MGVIGVPGASVTMRFWQLLPKTPEAAQLTVDQHLRQHSVALVTSARITVVVPRLSGFVGRLKVWSPLQ